MSRGQNIVYRLLKDPYKPEPGLFPNVNIQCIPDNQIFVQNVKYREVVQ